MVKYLHMISTRADENIKGRRNRHCLKTKTVLLKTSHKKRGKGQKLIAFLRPGLNRELL